MPRRRRSPRVTGRAAPRSVEERPHQLGGRDVERRVAAARALHRQQRPRRPPDLVAAALLDLDPVAGGEPEVDREDGPAATNGTRAARAASASP